MIPRKILLITVLLIAVGQNGFARSGPKTVRFSAFSEAVSMPVKFIQKPIHPGLAIGTDLWIRPKTHWQQSLGADLSFYHHRVVENAVLLDAMYSVGYKFGFGLQTKFLAGIGYKHSFQPVPVYKLEEGEYRKVMNWGTPHLGIKLGLGLEFPLGEKLGITADYKFMLAAPYSEALPFTPHTFTGLGVKINLAAGDESSLPSQQ